MTQMHVWVSDYDIDYACEETFSFTRGKKCVWAICTTDHVYPDLETPNPKLATPRFPPKLGPTTEGSVQGESHIRGPFCNCLTSNPPSAPHNPPYLTHTFVDTMTFG